MNLTQCSKDTPVPSLGGIFMVSTPRSNIILMTPLTTPIVRKSSPSIPPAVRTSTIKYIYMHLYLYTIYRLVCTCMCTYIYISYIDSHAFTYTWTPILPGEEEWRNERPPTVDLKEDIFQMRKPCSAHHHPGHLRDRQPLPHTWSSTCMQCRQPGRSAVSDHIT